VTARAPGYRAATARVDAKGAVEVTLVMDRSP
jgi:hypothetical protein